VSASKIRFTKHAAEKFEVLKHYGFAVNRKQVIETVLNPEHLDKSNDQFFATKTIDSEHCLRVVYEKGKII
jgi:hypothetical protein